MTLHARRHSLAKDDAAGLKIDEPGAVTLIVSRGADHLELARRADARLRCCVLDP
jgi:hypothetical protein